MRLEAFALDFEFVPRSLCSIEGWGLAVGLGVAAAVGAGGAIVAGSEQASGEEQAANTQAATESQIQQIEQPYVQQGTAADTTLSQLLGTSGTPGSTVSGTGLPQGYLTQTFNPTQSQLEAYPGYQFQLSQGDQAIQNAASATGGALSGAALKQLSTFNQGLAASNYQNYFSQFQTQQNNIYNRLAGIAQLGQGAASQTAASSAQLGSGVAQAQAAAAGATAGGTVGATNAVGNNATLATILAANGSLGSSSYSPIADIASTYGSAEATDPYFADDMVAAGG